VDLNGTVDDDLYSLIEIEGNTTRILTQAFAIYICQKSNTHGSISRAAHVTDFSRRERSEHEHIGAGNKSMSSGLIESLNVLRCNVVNAIVPQHHSLEGDTSCGFERHFRAPKLLLLQPHVVGDLAASLLRLASRALSRPVPPTRPLISTYPACRP
jgi:hypothetical protein